MVRLKYKNCPLCDGITKRVYRYVGNTHLSFKEIFFCEKCDYIFSINTHQFIQVDKRNFNEHRDLINR